MINKNYIKNRPNLRAMIILAISALISWVFAIIIFMISLNLLMHFLPSEGLDKNVELARYQPIFQYIIATQLMY